MKQVFRNRVVGDEDIHPAILIVVGDSHAQSLARLVDTHLVRYFGELAVAIVVIQKNRNGFEDIRMAIGTITWFVLATIDVVEVPHHVTGDDKVEPSVIVVIQPGCACRPTRASNSCAIGHVCKSSISVVVIEIAVAIAGNE